MNASAFLLFFLSSSAKFAFTHSLFHLSDYSTLAFAHHDDADVNGGNVGVDLHMAAVVAEAAQANATAAGQLVSIGT